MRSSGPRHPHPIRLRGPWHYQVLDTASATTSPAQGAATSEGAAAVAAAPSDSTADAAGAPSGRLRLPADWSSALGRNFRGRVRFTRHFHCPQGLDAHERVWLVCEGADAQASWRVNDIELPPIAGYALRAEADITARLKPRNRLELDVELPADVLPQQRPGRQLLPGGPIGEVRLEVRRLHWIDHLEISPAWVADRPLIDVRGRVCGPSHETSSLELVVEVAGHEAAWLPCEVGKSFSLSLPLEHPPLWPEHPLPVRVRLLQGGQRLWECRHVTGLREVRWISLPEAALDIQGRRFPLPWPTADPLAPAEVDAWPASGLDRAVGSGLVLEAILPEAAYARLDEIGARIIQAVPEPWAADVCSRLMHHPSIVAWCDAEPATPHRPIDETTPPHIRYGRLWLPRQVAIAASDEPTQHVSEQAGEH